MYTGHIEEDHGGEEKDQHPLRYQELSLESRGRNASSMAVDIAGAGGPMRWRRPARGETERIGERPDIAKLKMSSADWHRDGSCEHIALRRSVPQERLRQAPIRLLTVRPAIPRHRHAKSMV